MQHITDPQDPNVQYVQMTFPTEGEYTEWVTKVESDTPPEVDQRIKAETHRNHPYYSSRGNGANAHPGKPPRERKRPLKVKNKDYERLIGLCKGRYTRKLSVLRKRHDASLSLDDILCEVIPGQEWTVTSIQLDAGVFTVRRVKDNCLFCDVLCTECQACLHSHTCTCSDNARYLNMCTHIHLVCRQVRLSRTEENVIQDYELETLRAAEVAELLVRLSHPSKSGKQPVSSVGVTEVDEVDLDDSSDCSSITDACDEIQRTMEASAAKHVPRSSVPSLPKKIVTKAIVPAAAAARAAAAAAPRAPLVTRPSSSSVTIDMIRQNALQLTGEIVGLIESAQDQDEILCIVESLSAVRPKIEALKARRDTHSGLYPTTENSMNSAGDSSEKQRFIYNQQTNPAPAQVSANRSGTWSASGATPVMRSPMIPPPISQFTRQSVPGASVPGSQEMSAARTVGSQRLVMDTSAGVQRGRAVSVQGSAGGMQQPRQSSSLLSFRHVAPGTSGGMNEWWAMAQDQDQNQA